MFSRLFSTVRFLRRVSSCLTPDFVGAMCSRSSSRDGNPSAEFRALPRVDGCCGGVSAPCAARRLSHARDCFASSEFFRNVFCCCSASVALLSKPNALTSVRPMPIIAACLRTR
eukprot:11098-Pelagococcus_subviridis.AAC.2